MTALPLKTAISDTYPNPSNATARAGFAQLWDAVNELSQASEIDLAAAATCDIGGQLSTKLRITGTTTITSFGVNYRGPILLRFSAAVTLTHNATTLRCPGAVDIVTAAGDVLVAWPTATVSGTLDGWQVAVLARGTGLLPIASGGTGASTAAAAFSAIKQDATTSATGVVELATNAEAQAGNDAIRAVTPANLGATVLGLGQSWTNMVASRAVSTTYTNSTGRTIVLNILGVLSAANSYIAVTINGFNYIASSSVNAGQYACVTGVMVTPGSTYSVAASSGTLSSIIWTELR
jgi:hypothetical protein